MRCTLAIFRAHIRSYLYDSLVKGSELCKFCAYFARPRKSADGHPTETCELALTMSAAVTLAVAMLLTASAHGGEVRRMRHPAFSWRTVPVFAETSNVSGVFDEDAVQQLARFPLFVAEKVSAWRCALAGHACAHTHMHAPRCGTLQAKPRNVRDWSLSSRS
jgi:hypothetical protein